MILPSVRAHRAAVLVAVLAVAAAAGCSSSGTASPVPSAVATGRTSGAASPSPTSAVPPTAAPAPASTQAPHPTVPPVAGSALAALATLPVKGRAPRTGYDRALFGQRWADTDRNGCDTRNDVLRRDLREVVLDPGTGGCVVLAGTLPDPFSGSDVPFERGPRSAEVQVDHVVALSDAWQKGAQQWTPARRLAFANDPLNLLAVQGSLNAQKSDGDAATWLPPHRPFRCAYVARQVAVKARYGAWVTAAERDAVARVLAGCPDEPLPSSDHPVEPGSGVAPDRPPAGAPPATGAAPGAPAAPSPAAPAAPDAGCDPSYPDVCIPPPSAVGDLDCGDVDARDIRVVAPDPHRFDADGDGAGCVSR